MNSGSSGHVSSTGLGGGSTALRRWQSNHSLDCAAALGMSRTHEGDVGPELLTWHFGGDESNLETLSEWLTMRVAAYARVAGVPLPSDEAKEWAPQIAAAHAMHTVQRPHAERHRGAKITTEAIAKRLHIRKASYLKLKKVAEACIRATLQGAYQSYLGALGVLDGAELRSPPKAYLENMDQKTLSSTTLPPQAIFSDSTCNDMSAFLDLAVLNQRQYEAMEAWLRRVAVERSNSLLADMPYVAVNEAASYPANTFAKHRRGIIMAMRETAPIAGGSLSDAGWTVLASRFHDLRIEHNADRPGVVRFIFEETSGNERTFPMFFPIPLDAGEYQHGNRYDPLAIVTLNGTSWMARCETDEVPGTGDAWERDPGPMSQDNVRAVMEQWSDLVKDIVRHMLTDQTGPTQ